MLDRSNGRIKLRQGSRRLINALHRRSWLVSASVSIRSYVYANAVAGTWKVRGRIESETDAAAKRYRSQTLSALCYPRSPPRPLGGTRPALNHYQQFVPILSVKVARVLATSRQEHSSFTMSHLWSIRTRSWKVHAQTFAFKHKGALECEQYMSGITT